MDRSARSSGTEKSPAFEATSQVVTAATTDAGSARRRSTNRIGRDSFQRGSLRAPRRRPLVSIADPERGAVIEQAPSDLQRERQTVSGESHADARRRIAGGIERRGHGFLREEPRI